MKNLQAVIDQHMESAQTIWADDMDMKEMAIQDAVDAFVIKNKGREWTEKTFGIEFA